MQKIICKDTGEVCLSYSDYLNSVHWLYLKKKYLNEFKVCQLCQDNAKLELHHITYLNVGNELPKDLILLCRSCHQFAHSLPKNEVLSKYIIPITQKKPIKIIPQKLPKKKKKKRSGDTWTMSKKIR